jgi:hypothetical protein
MRSRNKRSSLLCLEGTNLTFLSCHPLEHKERYIQQMQATWQHGIRSTKLGIQYRHDSRRESSTFVSYNSLSVASTLKRKRWARTTATNQPRPIQKLLPVPSGYKYQQYPQSSLSLSFSVFLHHVSSSTPSFDYRSTIGAID